MNWLWAINCSCKGLGFRLGWEILSKWSSFRPKRPILGSKELLKRSKWELACRRRRKSLSKNFKENKNTLQMSIHLRTSKKFCKNLGWIDILLFNSYIELMYEFFQFGCKNSLTKDQWLIGMHVFLIKIENYWKVGSFVLNSRAGNQKLPTKIWLNSLFAKVHSIQIHNFFVTLLQ